MFTAIRRSFSLIGMLGLLCPFVFIASSALAQNTTTLTIIGWTAEVQSVMDDPEPFKSLHPDIDLEFIITERGKMVEQTTVRVAGGNSPDVIWTDDGIIMDFGNLGVLEPLAPYVEKSGLDLSQYASTVSSEYGGVLYAMPGTAYPYIFFINSNMLQESGLARPADTWTFEEYEQVSERMTRGPIEQRTAWGTVRPTLRWDGFTWSAGGWPFKNGDIDQEGWDNLIEVLQWMADMQYIKRITAQGDGQFHQGMAGMGHFGFWIFNNPNYADWNFSHTAQVAPVGKAGQIPKFITNGWSISKESKHKDEAWTFIEWYVSPEQQMTMPAKMQMPAYLPAVREVFTLGYQREVVEAFVKTFDLAAPGKPAPQNLNEVKALGVVQSAMSQIINGRNPSAADALNSVKDAVRAALAGNP